jgi:hypothetical protein
MRVFITKYALTKGIFNMECEVSGDVARANEPGWMLYLHGEGREWHKTRESAVDEAERMRFRKILCLSRQIAKLENKKFS